MRRTLIKLNFGTIPIGVLTKIIVLAIVFALLRCGGNDETELRIDIAEHPESGVYVTELPCIIVGCLYDKDEVTPITTDFQWMWSETSAGPDTALVLDHYIFTETSMEEVNLSLFAPEGYYFVGFWWMEIYWTDEDGTAHYLETNKAHCTGTFKKEFSISPIRRTQNKSGAM